MASSPGSRSAIPAAKVFEIAWTKAGDFKTIAFEPGEWEDALGEQGGLGW